MTEMVSLDCVSRFNWDKNLGKKIKQLRGKISRRSLSDQLKSAGCSCSPQFIQKLEDGRAASVEPALLVAICKVIGAELGQVIPAIPRQGKINLVLEIDIYYEW